MNWSSYADFWRKTVFVLLLSAEKIGSSYSPKSAEASACVYSLVETAKANNLDPFHYLQCLLLIIPGSKFRKDEKIMQNLMPWSPFMQTQCKVNWAVDTAFFLSSIRRLSDDYDAWNDGIYCCTVSHRKIHIILSVTVFFAQKIGNWVLIKVETF